MQAMQGGYARHARQRISGSRRHRAGWVTGVLAGVGIALGTAVAVRGPGEVSGQVKPVEITVVNFEFQPKEVQVRVGTPVVWKQKGGGRHAVTALDGSFTSEVLGADGNFTYTPTKPGKIRYYCKFHGDPTTGDMSAVLDVR